MRHLLALLLVIFPLSFATPATGQQSSHVFVLMLENRSDAEAMRYMPYLSQLANQNGRGLQVYSPSHGSFNAYLEMVAGSAPKNGVADNGNCNGDGCRTAYIHDNLVRELSAKRLSWRGYFQSLPYSGYMGYQSGDYVRRHNPFPFLSDVINDHNQQLKMVAWGSNFARDIANGNVASYTLLVPDLTHDGHNPTSDTPTALRNADAYLAANLPALLNSRYFQPGGDGVLIVTFDESDLQGDNSCSWNVKDGCGGHIFLAVIGPGVNFNYQTSTHLMQNDLLRGTCDLLRLYTCPGDGARGIGVAEFFNTNNDRTQVTITAPYDYFRDAGPYTNLKAQASSGIGPIVMMAVYVDGQLFAYFPQVSSLNIWVPTSIGPHTIGVNAWDSHNGVAVDTVHITRTY